MFGAGKSATSGSPIPSCRRPAAKTRTRHSDLVSPECSRQRQRPAATPLADNARQGLNTTAILRGPAIARARRLGRKLAFDQFFDKGMHPLSHRAIGRIKPADVHHGVVSCLALRRQPIRGSSLRRLRHPQFQPIRRQHQLVRTIADFPRRTGASRVDLLALLQTTFHTA